MISELDFRARVNPWPRRIAALKVILLAGLLALAFFFPEMAFGCDTDDSDPGGGGGGDPSDPPPGDNGRWGQVEIYTTGGGYHITEIMNFLAMMTAGPTFGAMMYLGVICGVIFIAIKLAVFTSGNGILRYLAAIAVVGGMGVGPKTNVIVLDTTYPLEVYSAVSNVPTSIALVAHFTTSAS